MTATLLEPETELGSTRAMPVVTLGWAALTAWVGWQGQQGGWRPFWVYPPLLAVMVAGLLVLVFVTVEGMRQQRALRHATTTLDRPFLAIGERARLSVQTGADPDTALAVDVHLEGREYTRKFVAKNMASKSGGGWSQKDRLVYRGRACEAVAPEGARLDNLTFVVPTDIHPSVANKPHGIDWILRIRIKAGKAPVWDAKYPVTIRGRNGSGVSLDSKVEEFQFPTIDVGRLPKLP